MAKDSIWNDDLVNQLKDLYLNREMTTVNIAKELGFTKNAIIGKIHRLQLNSLKDSKIAKTDIKIVLKKETTNPTKVMKEKTVITYNTDDDVKTVIDIAKKSNTVTNKVDVPFVIDNETLDINSMESNISTKATSPFSEDFEHNITTSHFSQSNKEQASIERGRYKLSEIEFNMCVWPFGEDEFTFCGDKTVSGKSYCQAHLDLVYFVTKKVPKKKYAELGEGVDIEEDDVEEEVEEIEI